MANRFDAYGSSSPDAPRSANDQMPNAPHEAEGPLAKEASGANGGAVPDEQHSPAPASMETEASTLGRVHEPQRLHPMTLFQRVLTSLPAVLAFILIPVVTSSNSESWSSLIFAVLYGVLALPAIVLQYYRFSYRITPKQVVIQSGVFNRQNRSIPIERVQNIQIEQSLLARIFGIAKVKLETAGSSSTEGVLEYVGLDKAHEIRQAVRSFQRSRKSAPSTAGASSADASEAEAGVTRTQADPEAATETHAETLFEMPLARVLLAGAFRFSLLYIAVVFSVLQFFDVEAIVDWFLRSRGMLEGVTTALAASPWLSALAGILVAALFGWVTGIFITLNRYYGFRLWLEEDKLRKRHGLLTVTEGTIPLGKVQTLIVRTNPLMRWFGWYTLEVQTVGVDVDEQGHRTIVPFAQHGRVMELARRVRSFDLPDTFHSVSPLTVRRAAVRYTFGVLALVVPAAYFWPADWWMPGGYAAPWYGLLLLPLLYGFGYLQYRFHGYDVRDEGFYVRRGVFSQYLWIMPTEKHHVFYTAASVFQRRLKLSTLFVDTAGAAAFAYPEVVDLPAPEAQSRLQQLERRFRTLYHERIERATGSASTRLSPEERPSLPTEHTPLQAADAPPQDGSQND